MLKYERILPENGVELQGLDGTPQDVVWGCQDPLDWTVSNITPVEEGSNLSHPRKIGHLTKLRLSMLHWTLCYTLD